MSERILNPDLGFVKDVISAGGESLKKCYQCATCSVVCGVSPDDSPFPRKEMIQAQWGLKDELFKNPDIWLCHQCSDCTANCPRGAKPGEVLNAIRKMSIAEFSAPKFLTNIVNKPAALIPLLAAPLVILLVWGYLYTIKNVGPLFNAAGAIYGSSFVADGQFKFIDPLFGAAAVFAVAMLAMGINKYWKAMSSALPADAAPKMELGQAIEETIKDVLGHERFKKCEVTKARSTAHMLVLYSFIGLFATTLLALTKMIPEYFALNWSATFIAGLVVVYKVLGTVSGVGLVAGILLVMSNRSKNAPKAGMGSYYDWLFISLVAALGITGLLTLLLRLANLPIAFWVYMVHLMAVFFLFAYAPYSKMAHMFYRATAMVFARMTGRM